MQRRGANGWNFSVLLGGACLLLWRVAEGSVAPLWQGVTSEKVQRYQRRMLASIFLPYTLQLQHRGRFF
jgi:hypothetical protein